MGKTAAALVVVVLVAAVGGGVGKAQPSRTQTGAEGDEDRVAAAGGRQVGGCRAARRTADGARRLRGWTVGRHDPRGPSEAGSVRVGRLPLPTHDAAAAVVRGSVYLFGGGASFSMPSVVRIDPITSQAKEAPALDEPLSDLGAVTIGRHIYLVGGYTGAEFASAILRYDRHGGTSTVGRLPHRTRYAGVARLGRTIYVAGGLTPARRDERRLRGLAARPRAAGGDAAGAGGPRRARRARRPALPRGRRQRPRDRPGLGEGLARGAAAGFALRPDGDDGRPAHRRDRRRDERRLVAEAARAAIVGCR